MYKKSMHFIALTATEVSHYNVVLFIPSAGANAERKRINT